MVSEIISYRGKSALRDVGKVFGLSLEQTVIAMSGRRVVVGFRLGDAPSSPEVSFDVTPDRLIDPGSSRRASPRTIAASGLVLAKARAIQGYPRHLSIHVGGFVLSADPLELVAPVEPATMKDRTVIPWDKETISTPSGFSKSTFSVSGC